MQQRDNSQKKKHEWTLFSKAFNIHSRQGNANENCFAFSLHSSHKDYHQEDKQQTPVRKRGGGRGTLIQCQSKCEQKQLLWESICRFLKKLKMELP